MTLSPEVRRYLERAERAIEVAQSMLGQGYAGPCASQAYYAMFYAAQALLLADGIRRRRHTAVEAAFGEHFARTGLLDRELHRALIDARGARETADYGVMTELVEEEASKRLCDAQRFVAAAKARLANHACDGSEVNDVSH